MTDAIEEPAPTEAAEPAHVSQQAEAAEPLFPVEYHAALETPDRKPLAKWQLAAVRAFHRWPIGREMTASAFAKAVDAALNAVIR